MQNKSFVNRYEYKNTIKLLYNEILGAIILMCNAKIKIGLIFIMQNITYDILYDIV